MQIQENFLADLEYDRNQQLDQQAKDQRYIDRLNAEKFEINDWEYSKFIFDNVSPQYQEYFKDGLPKQEPLHLESYLRTGYFPSRPLQRTLLILWVFFWGYMILAGVFAPIIGVTILGGLLAIFWGGLIFGAGYVLWEKGWIDWPGVVCAPLYNRKLRKKFPKMERQLKRELDAEVERLNPIWEEKVNKQKEKWEYDIQAKVRRKSKSANMWAEKAENSGHNIEHQQQILDTTQTIAATTAKNLANVRQQRPTGFPVPHGRELDLQFYLHLHEILVTEQETAIGPAIKLAETRFENRENTMALGQLIEKFRQTVIEEFHNQNQLMKDLNDEVVSRLDKQIDLLDNLTGTVSRGMSDVTSGLKSMDKHLEKVNTAIADTNQLIKQSNEEIANDLNSLVDYANRREQRLTRR